MIEGPSESAVMTAPVTGEIEIAAVSAGPAGGASAAATASGSLHRFARRRGAVVGCVYLLALIVLAVAAPYIAVDPNEVDLNHVVDGPMVGHWLGYDNLGRDIFSRLMFASQVSLLAATIAMLVAVLVGLPFGLLSAYSGGWVDLLLSRIVDGLLSVPGFLKIVVIVAVLRPGLISAMIAIGIASAPTFFRIVRASTLGIRSETYVEAAILSSASTLRILLRHVLPNISGPILVQMAITMSAAIMAEAGLSFIGLGVQPPQASWGSMLRQAASFMGSSPVTYILSPVATLVAVVLSFNAIADAIYSSIGARR